MSEVIYHLQIQGEDVGIVFGDSDFCPCLCTFDPADQEEEPSWDVRALAVFGAAVRLLASGDMKPRENGLVVIPEDLPKDAIALIEKALPLQEQQP